MKKFFGVLFLLSFFTLIAVGFLELVEGINAKFVSIKGLDAPMRILFLSEDSVTFDYNDTPYRVELKDRWVASTENPTLVQFEWDLGGV
ncbi:hypothetical protein KBG31_00805 [Patescibacteria group bacterium]|nr:hypothetical protein [Patescibacteria group bacterium]